MPYYVYRQDGSIVAKCYYEPSKEDISSRGERCIESDEEVDIERYEVKDGKLVAKPVDRKRKIYEERQRLEGIIDHEIRAKFLDYLRAHPDEMSEKLKELIRKRDELQKLEDSL